MGLYVRSRLRALPILNATTFSLRSTVSLLINISEPSPLGIVTIKTALDKLSDTELEKYTEPERIRSTSEAVVYTTNRRAQSSEYNWRQQACYLFLLARSKFAKRLSVPGVVFEFMIRTGPSTWTVHQIPDPGNILEHPSHFERNELMAHTNRPLRLPICPMRENHSSIFCKLAQAVKGGAARKPQIAAEIS